MPIAGVTNLQSPAKCWATAEQGLYIGEEKEHQQCPRTPNLRIACNLLRSALVTPEIKDTNGTWGVQPNESIVALRHAAG